jgi:hypothetical protein
MIDARLSVMQQFPYLTLPTPTLLRYTLMVGVPLCVLLAMLELGKGITAATPVAGEWRLERLTEPEKTSCSAEEILAEPNPLAVVQAGQFLTARHGAASLEGRIAGDAVTLSGGSSIVIARLASGGPVLSMEGTIANSAGGCDPVPFRARLVTPTVRPLTPGGHH